MKKYLLYAATMLAFVATSFNANALYDDGGSSLDRVTITYTRPYTNWYVAYDSSTMTPPTLFAPSYRAGRGPIATEEYQELREEVAKAVTNKKNSSDARCNVLASTATRQTTSRNDATDRFMAAEQLFTAIAAELGVAGVRAAIGGSPPALRDGKYVSTFTMTYMDGGSEKWAVAPGITPSLIIDGNIGPPPSGDGVVKPCPLTMQG